MSLNDFLTLKPVAYIRTDFDTKFSVPRQPRLVEDLCAQIILEPEYRKEGILRGLEQFSHLWLIWGFSRNPEGKWSPTVRPPRLGGNTRMGIFATRSPFRPNPVGLSCVRILAVHGDSIEVAGADLVDGTPVYDIKPYVPYADCIPDASSGFAAAPDAHVLQVVIPEELKKKIPAEKLVSLTGVLSQDPRPAYHHDPDRIYGFSFAHMEIRFCVKETVLTVTEVLL